MFGTDWFRPSNLSQYWQNREILPSITTIPGFGTAWSQKVAEIGKLGLKRACIFPTCLKYDKRQELYKELEKTDLKQIPFAHIRDDFDIHELGYLRDRWGTEVFNIHTRNYHNFLNPVFDGFRKNIFIEISPGTLFSQVPMESFGGMCIDFAHLENDSHSPEYPNQNQEIIERLKNRFSDHDQAVKTFKAGCSHISAYPKNKWDGYLDKDWNEIRCDLHVYKDLSDFDYLKKYFDYLPNINAMELQNSLEDQIKAIQYIYKMG